MGKFINYLERKIGKYAIPRLPLYMIICYAIGYVMQLVNPEIMYVLSLDPYAIIHHGQIWRLFSWLLIPPESGNLFFTLIMLYFYYSLGQTLERTWGTFYFNYYIFSGLIFTIIGSFLLYGYQEFFMAEDMITYDQYYTFMNGVSCPWVYGGHYGYAASSLIFSTFYINMSIFLGFAATYPNTYVMLFFIIPIKVKVLGIIYAIILVINAYGMGISGLIVIGASLLNFVLFFLATRKGMHRSFAQVKRQREYKVKVKQAKAEGISKHKCAICGRTSEEYPDLDFRFCSKCEGNYEYCQDHLFTHTHIKK